MRRYQLWLLAIVFFVVPMVVAFVVSDFVRKAKTHSHSQLDPDLAVAIETSRRTLPQFIEKLNKPPADAIAFAVKATFIENGHPEMMWVDHITYANGAFDGTLADVPVVTNSLHKGDHVKVSQADVVDWEILYHTTSGDVHEGAETDRVLRRRQAGHTLRYPRRMQTSTLRLA